MIELTEAQARAIDQAQPLPVVVHPHTRETFVLVPKDRFEVMLKWMGAIKRNWDNPADNDLIAQP